MSDLTDQIDKALKKLQEMNPGDHVHADELKGVNDVECMDGFQRYLMEESLKVMRRIYRRYAGAEPFASPQEALDKTEDVCIKELSKLCASCLADGILIGQGKVGAVRKAAFFKKMDEVFDKPGFRVESDLFVVNAKAEYDFTEAIERYFRTAMEMMTATTGYTATRDRNIHKIWDLWLLAANSTSIGMFATGLIVGKEWAEKDILDGILAATTVNEESE